MGNRGRRRGWRRLGRRRGNRSCRHRPRRRNRHGFGGRWRSRRRSRAIRGRRLPGLGLALGGLALLALLARLGVTFGSFLFNSFLLGLLAATPGDDRSDLRAAGARFIDGTNTGLVLAARAGRRQAAGCGLTVGAWTGARAANRRAGLEPTASRQQDECGHGEQAEETAIADHVQLSPHHRHPN